MDLNSISRARFITSFTTTHPPNTTNLRSKMLPRAANQAGRVVARRAFSTTRAQLSSPYHYAEGPYSNLPFNPKTKYFGVRFWSFMGIGFFAPFGISLWQTYKPK